MCSKPIINTIAQAGKDVGSAFERNVSQPVGTAAKNTASYFEDNISKNVKKAADDTGKWWEQNVSDPTGNFFRNSSNWFDVKQPGVPEVPTGDPEATFVGTTDVAGMKKRRKANAMRFGIMSTIGTSGQGTAGAPMLAAPASQNLKLKLGQ